jgi:hypothetical protein
MIGIGMWFFPRQVVKSATLMETNKSEYDLNEPIIVSGETWTNVDSAANFDVRLICNGVKYAYTQINDLQVSKQVAPVKYKFSYGKVPEYIPNGSTCRIETTADYTVQVLPLLNRHYQYKFNSNGFQIKE